MTHISIETIPTDLFGANCYLAYTDINSDALVVDPGLGAAGVLRQRLGELGKQVGAVLLTHGHPDHVWEAAAVSTLNGAADPAPVYLPGPDMSWLADPLGKLNLPQSAELGGEWVAPAGVVEAPVGSWQPVAGISVNLVPAPGHSAGSCVILIGGNPTVDGDRLGSPTAFSADVIFAGSIGRTDLPGGDDQEMDQTLRTLVAALDPATVLLPGHGPRTDWATELETNQYVRRAAGR